MPLTRAVPAVLTLHGLIEIGPMQTVLSLLGLILGASSTGHLGALGMDGLTLEVTGSDGSTIAAADLGFAIPTAILTLRVEQTLIVHMGISHTIGGTLVMLRHGFFP